jgi:hypothetical protein
MPDKNKSAHPANLEALERWANNQVVNQIVAGTGVTITSQSVSNSPGSLGTGVVTINASGGGGGYASLTGTGETTTPGDLTQDGGFTVNDSAGDGITLDSTGGTITEDGDQIRLNSVDGTFITNTTTDGINVSDNSTTGIHIIENEADAPITLTTTSGSTDTITLTTSDINLNCSVKLGFFGNLVAQQVVTGSRGGNTALASLLTALANTGLIIDSSTP